MHFTSEKRLDGDVIERDFLVGEIPGVLWTPASRSAPVPLILMGHPGGLRSMYPRLVRRARGSIAQGFAAATIELPGGGERPTLAAVERARAELREAIMGGKRPSEDVIDRLVLPLVERAVPEWQATLDALLELPEIGGPIGLSGGVIAIGVRLAVIEPRIIAAGLFAGSHVPRSIIEEARQVTIPLHVLLQWDDEGNDRQLALDLFDAFGSREKTLCANMGGHTGVPWFAGEDAGRFFARHLSRAPWVDLGREFENPYSALKTVVSRRSRGVYKRSWRPLEPSVVDSRGRMVRAVGIAQTFLRPAQVEVCQRKCTSSRG